MSRFYFTLLISFLLSPLLQAQVLRGKITDSQQNPIPFSTVFVKEVSFGSAANEDGQFELHLPEGNYTCVFQSMGYQTVTRIIAVGRTSEPIVIVLPDMVYSLSEVEISDGGEDPAYRIMRKVIRKAPLYAAMVKSFNAEVYIRGSLQIRKISAMIKWMAREDLKESQIKEGETYLEESVNEIDFTAPNLTRQKVKSIYSTFPGGNENRSSGAIGFISGNIYHPNAFGNARSPLAPGAFNYYRFRYEGVNTYGDVVVDKIKIIPRGDGPQYVSGYLYIIEGLWCIYSLDINIDEQLGMSIQLTQSYGEVREGAWLPVNNRFKIDMDLMGNEGGFLYNTSIRYNDLVVNPPDLKPKKPAELSVKEKTGKSKVAEARIAKLDKKAAELNAIENPTTSESYKLAKAINKKAEIKQKDSLRTNHTYIETYKTVFDSNARKSDSVYWKSIRPIPLAINELKSVRAFDSIQYRQNASKADSIKAARSNGRKLFNTLLTGGRYAFDTLRSLQSDGLLNPFGLSFNTVDGFVYKMKLAFERKINTNSAFSADFTPGFALSRKEFLWDASLGFMINEKQKHAISLQFGSGSFDYNQNVGANSIENSISSLFFRQNLLRLHNKDYVALKHSINLNYEFSLITKVSASESRMLENKSDFSFFYRDEREYKLNVPDNSNFEMQNHRDFLFDISLTYKAMPYYVVKEGIKVPRYGMNMTPAFTLGYKKAIPLNGFDSDFDLISISVKQKLKVGHKSNISYMVEGGYFMNDKTVFFDDFRHFSTQPLVLGVKEFFPVKQFGDYYRYSTDAGFAEAHFVYQTPFLLLKRLPLIRNRMWDESLMFNYIYTPEYQNSFEFGYGVGNYFYNVGLFAGFEDSKFSKVGLRVSLSVFGRKEIVIGM